MSRYVYAVVDRELFARLAVLVGTRTLLRVLGLEVDWNGASSGTVCVSRARGGR